MSYGWVSLDKVSISSNFTVSCLSSILRQNAQFVSKFVVIKALNRLKSAIKMVRSFADAQLCHQLLQNLHQVGFTKPTPIQSRTIPIAMAGYDVMGCAQTGSGKTVCSCLFAKKISTKLIKTVFTAR